MPKKNEGFCGLKAKHGVDIFDPINAPKMPLENRKAYLLDLLRTVCKMTQEEFEIWLATPSEGFPETPQRVLESAEWKQKFDAVIYRMGTGMPS